ncbi:MAG: hypothetical protein JO159_03600 [Acidobacteria bacterium]|nr:hypothetical protein [Acidobacteriota bacterium]
MIVLGVLTSGLLAQNIPLDAIVNPSTIILKHGRPVTFAVHGFIEFKSLSELFSYIQSQKERWKFAGGIDEVTLQHVSRDLLKRGIESRIISMVDERPLETLLTHTGEELRQALTRIKEPLPPGYAEEFLAVQAKWKTSLNCWSASPSIAGRVLSNWYPIDEGIQLYGGIYDSTEHFWQAVKYHPETSVAGVMMLLGLLQHNDWSAWLNRLESDPKLYLPNAYSVEFLRHNLAPERLRWFAEEIARLGLRPDDRPRMVQQRGQIPFRFSAYEEKVLWGDLGDLFHLVYIFSAANDPLRRTLADRHFDAIYLGDRKMGFISEEFRSLMFDIWKVKFLQIPRLREVIASIPIEIRLEHFLNDGDSPDIPIPVYVEYLNRIRDLALAQTR